MSEGTLGDEAADDRSPFETSPPAARDVRSDDELGPSTLSAEGHSALGGGKLEATAQPGSPLDAALATVPAAAAGIGWMIAAGWTFGRAIPLPHWVAAVIALVPALGLIVAAPFQAVRKARSQGSTPPSSAARS